MKKLSVLATLFPLLYVQLALATPVGPMNFQGRLLDDGGVPVTGSYDFQVEIFDAVSGGASTYSEDHLTVQVDDGVYNLVVGTGSSPAGNWSVEMWQGDMDGNGNLNRYMEIRVRTSGAGAYEVMTPRHELMSAPHAFSSTMALTLNGRSIDDFDNILKSVCENSAGKWLDLLDTCLGADSVVNSETLATMLEVVEYDFTSLNLNSADLTGSSFSGVDVGTSANFKASDFTDATLTLSGLEYAALTNTNWNNTTITDVGAVTLGGSLVGATFKDMDMSKFDLSAVADMTGVSAGGLTACPALLPANWYCQTQNPSVGGAPYFLIGPGANLSKTSALVKTTEEGLVLDLAVDAIDAVSNLASVSFNGITITQNMNPTSFDNADFTDAKVVNAKVIVLSGGSADNINLTNSEWIHSWFGMYPDVTTAKNIVFDGIEFKHSLLGLPSLLVMGTSLDFKNAIFENSRFTAVDTAELKFDNAVLFNSFINVETNHLTITNSRISGRFAMETDAALSSISNSFIQTAEFSGNFSSWDFTGNDFKHVYFDGDFTSTYWDDNDFDHPVYGHDFTGATSNLNNIVSNERWKGTCPNGTAPVSESCTFSW